MSRMPGWKKFMAVGCSHSNYADPEAIKGVLEFRERWKPDEVIHLGDFLDLSAFMGSAKGEGDEVEGDISSGLRFLYDLRPTVVLCGNHEARLWREVHSRDERVAIAAGMLIDRIKNHKAVKKSAFLEYDGIWQSYQLANYKFTHGTVYGANAPLDMANMYGNVIFAHTHKVGRMTGTRSDSPTGISVGTLTKRGAMDYANTRRATFAWSQGMAFGYYNDKTLVPWLHEQPHDLKKWVLPI